MFDQLIGLLLVGLGINTSFYTPNPNVKGVETEATTTAAQKEPKKTFRLDPKNFELRGPISTASTAGLRKPKLDTHAFGLSVMKMHEDFAAAVEASRESAKKEFEDHKTVFQEQLARIKDTKKQRIVEKVSTNCEDINTRRSDKMTQMLGKLSTILTNVSNRAASASADGKDTSDVETAVTTAQAAIADAQLAVASQSGVTCTITITSDSTAKSEVGGMIRAFQSQLKSVYEKVVAARNAVGDAIRTMGVVTGERL
jgi:hypothetical protein